MLVRITISSTQGTVQIMIREIKRVHQTHNIIRKGILQILDLLTKRLALGGRDIIVFQVIAQGGLDGVKRKEVRKTLENTDGFLGDALVTDTSDALDSRAGKDIL